MAMQQPMSRGVGPGRYDSPTSVAEAVKVSKVQQRELIVESAQLEQYLLENPILEPLAEQMLKTMKEKYLQSKEGKMQIAFIKGLNAKIDPEMMLEVLANNELLRHMGPRLTAIKNATPAAPK